MLLFCFAIMLFEWVTAAMGNSAAKSQGNTKESCLPVQYSNKFFIFSVVISERFSFIF